MSRDIYGVHLTMRLAAIANQEALDSEASVNGFLIDLVRRLDMRILAGPLAGREDGPPDHAGCSGVVILYESHAAIHTYPHLGQAFLDVFSCKPFDPILAEEVIKQHFGSYEIIERQVADRGIHWERDVKRELHMWQTQR